MGWSLRVGRVVGIDLYVHLTLLLLLAWLTLGVLIQAGEPPITPAALLLPAGIVFLIVLHQLAHVLAARCFGIATREITLLPIGGVGRTQSVPERLGPELLIALTGPATCLALAGLFWAAGNVHSIADLERGAIWGGRVVDQLMLASLFLAAINLLPTLPMDGGRALQAVLSGRVGAGRATRVAAGIGQVMSVLVFAVGVVVLAETGDPVLVIVAAAIWFGALGEVAAALGQPGLAGVPVALVMSRDTTAVAPDDSLAAVARRARPGFQRDFPVVVAGRLVGLLTRTDLRAGLHRFGPGGWVFQAARRSYPTVGPDDPAEAGLVLLAAGHDVVPVLYYGRLIGLLTTEAVSEYLQSERLDTAGRRVTTDPSGARSGV